MQHEITKKCADSLRSFAQNNYGIQLKSSHAHELVAAYFGYSSRAALLADTNCPITNLRQAEFVILTPTAPIKNRCKELQGLPENLPHELVEGVYLPLYDENDKWISTKIWPNLEELGKALADQYLKSKPTFFSDQRVQRQGVKLEFENDLIAIVVFREYVSPYLTLATGKNALRGVVDVFNIKRVAGHIGFVKTDHYSTEADTLDGAIVKMRDFHHQIITSTQPINTMKVHEETEISFADWLAKQKNRDSRTGDLAQDVMKDKTWPTHDTLDSYRDYLYSRNASWQTVEALEGAWKAYKAYLKKKLSPTSYKPTSKPALKNRDPRTIVFIKNAVPLHYKQRTIEKFDAGAKAWISWEGRKAIPVTVLNTDEWGYSFRIERPLKNAGEEHSVRFDEVRSTPELACINHITY